MNPYNYKWAVKIPANCFMGGVHRFKTKKQATQFIESWNRTPGVHGLSYSQLPVPFKIWQTGVEGNNNEVDR